MYGGNDYLTPKSHSFTLPDVFNLDSMRKGTKRWVFLCTLISAATAACGALTLLLTLSVFATAKSTGLLLGGVVAAAGLLGCAAARRRSANMLNLNLVATILAIMLAFQFIGQAGREVEVDCALAELYVRTSASEAQVAQQAQAQVFQSLYTRLNEMEDMLTLAQTGALKKLELKTEQEHLKMTDETYIKAKLEMLKAHAKQLLNGVLEHPNLTAQTVAQLTPDQRAALQRRVDAADKALETIEKHHAETAAGGGGISLEEYNEVIRVLGEGFGHPLPEAMQSGNQAHPPAELHQAAQELPNMGAALHRQKSDTYHTYDLGGRAAEVAQLDAHRQAAREQWSQQFEAVLQQRHQRHQADWLQDLPQHCLVEDRRAWLVTAWGLSVTAALLASAYTILSLLFRVPVKGE